MTSYVIEMSGAVQGPPITRLNNDLLLLAFRVNADMFTDDKALRTTRLSSQVCQGWRTAILERPSLWGHLIDLDALTQRRSEWRTEILRRSKHAPLSIKGIQALFNPLYSYVQDTHSVGPVWSRREIPPWKDFFFLLLDTEWNRIERITVRVGSQISIPPDILYCPAPQLRVFEMSLSSQVKIPEGRSLFNNNAPMLRTFKSRELSFKLSAPWLQNLRSIEIGLLFPLSFVMDILKKTPCLKSLVYAGHYGDDAYDPAMLDLTSFTLGPNIEKLKIGTGFNSCLEFIRCTIPQNDYTLHVSTSQIDPHTSLESLSLYMTRHFQLHVPTHISLDLSHNFCFASRSANGAEFSLRVPCSIFPGNENQSKILTALQIPACPLVTELELKTNYQLRDEEKIATTEFLRLVSKVKILRVTDLMYPYLMEIQEQHSDVFLPRLDTLHADSVSDNLLHLLRMRWDVGCPISVLDLTKCERPGVLMISLENLQRFTGLTHPLGLMEGQTQSI